MRIKSLKFNNKRINKLSDLLIDLGKISVASIVIGYFLPGLSGEIPIIVFVAGSFASLILFIIGLVLTKEKL